MAVAVPPLPPPLQGVSRELSNYMATVNKWMMQELAKLMPRNEGVTQVFLVSEPGHKVYKLTVSDTGTLTTTLVVPGKTLP